MGEAIDCCFVLFFIVAKLLPIATSIAMLVYAFNWKSDVLSQLGQTDPCNVLDTVEVDNFKLTVDNVLVPLIVVGFLVLSTILFACNGDNLCSFALLLIIIVVEGILFGVISGGISKSADFYKAAIKNEPNPMRYYNWNDGANECSAAMDKFQSEAICCGYHDLSEWDKTRPSSWDKDIFPPSCCSDFALRTESATDRKWCTKKMISFSNVSCISQLKSWIFRQWVGTVAWIALGVGIFQILCFIIPVCKICSRCQAEPESGPLIHAENVEVSVPVLVRVARTVRRIQYYEEIRG